MTFGYVPGLNDSIVSKHWTKHSGLRTTMDEHENFQFYSIEPNNPFHMSTITIDKMSIISNIKAFKMTMSVMQEKVKFKL